MRYLTGLILIGAALSLHSVNAGELTSSSNKKLKRVIVAFPKSDTNGDDVLTMSELHNFVKKKMKDGATSKTNVYLKRCLLYTSPSPRDQRGSRMPSSA